ncbi:hypothetical protein [Deinococcus peraridilitoris]|uniref:Uncharacterized protein n=1 Tax=Deinococcus peraridilitoris (strain DSM 19664 / LMG 22246 / CIP 109416 / KR-200) TaxID=937777 RepID=K9ZZG5_DEIPD|nr:hypothetical protein [Deinococcus peraridilitoris]AFZ66327.1 hypothetical protein Deipe_0748 [Deinococcus peraridilitoris DSM 19664]
MARKRPAGSTAALSAEVTFRAGCGHSWRLASSAPDLAYTALEFPACVTCPHRVDSDGGGSFCTLRPEHGQHPFAVLAGLDLPD